MTAPVPWLSAFAGQRGLRYEPEADERWLRAWEPFSTLRVPIRYEHALHATGSVGSVSVARAIFELPSAGAAPSSVPRPTEIGTWLVIAQDERLRGRAATTSDTGGVFGEALDIVPLQRLQTFDPSFDHVFASFAEDPAALAQAVTPSLRKLLLGWRVPVHAELRPGGFVLAPVSVTADPAGLSWLLDAVGLFGAKAQKRAT